MVIDLLADVPQADQALALDWYQNNGYSDIGKAVFDIKYSYILNQSLTVGQLDIELNFLVDSLLEFAYDVDLILPVPSFNPNHKKNTGGDLKIMYMVAERLGAVSGRKFDFTVLEKTSSNQAKNSLLNESDYISKKLNSKIKNTAKYTISVLKRANPNIFVRFISLTKNKYGGVHKFYDCRISKYDAYHISDNGDASIDLYFYKNNKAERVKIWSNHNLFQEIKEAYDKKDFNKVFEFSIYKKQNGYWQIDDI